MAALTADQRETLAAIRRVLDADPEIEAAWLSGSLGRGSGDTFSDVDVLALVASSAAQVGLRYAREIDAIAPPALVMPLFGGRVLSVVTNEWQRFDLTFVEPADLARFSAAHLTVLFNRGPHAPSEAAPPPYQPSPEVVTRLVNEFLRILGLLVVGTGRSEHILGLTGCELLRRLLVDLMLEENGLGPADRGGALHLNRLLADEQRLALEGLAPVAATREGILASDLEIAALFLPRARELAAQVGATWPAAFEEATRRHLQRHLGLTLP